MDLKVVVFSGCVATSNKVIQNYVRLKIYVSEKFKKPIFNWLSLGRIFEQEKYELSLTPEFSHF